ncbi:hypothetical protein RGUI_2738 [Rhodovulum sp. P5]|uniref:type IV toxin-antitoxin system AbiEi family antitoxin domain-containing protein n=1 Tax=Rhodovulum sp. P5 TaxID=1564506 RepID=UPI0009C22882|nr:type IV toxin-antitoxin system AbiEi family antitoxin domain-containing protein [Rhodovulum sp. P5]ARE40879.1 hypothetical protein RGUI_2738 [Rhodovulum sp. P5]
MVRSPDNGVATRILQALDLSSGDGRATDELAHALGLSRRQVSRAAALLIRRGLAERLGPGCYRLTGEGRGAAAAGASITSGPTGPTGAVSRPGKDTFRDRAWRSMRQRRAFTVNDILCDAARDEKNSRNNALSYLGRLRRAGYVRELPRRQSGVAPTSPGFKQFLLVKDTGPLAPVWRSRRGCLHDPNIGEDVPCVTA